MLNATLRTTQFIDRLDERGVLDQLVMDVRAAQSQVLVLRGEAGCGKTALLMQLSKADNGCRIIWATGVEAEMELAYAGLHSLCTPLLDRLPTLPEPQRHALSTAFGMSNGPPPERFLVGLAVLSLLADAAEEQPLLCIVDDAQWLDQVSSQTLAFVARRLLADRVGLVFSARENGGEKVLAGLPELAIRGLDAEHARQLLEGIIAGPLDEHVKTRIIDETRGNPLALIELPRGMTPAEMAGGFAFPNTRHLTSRIEGSFLERHKELSRDSQLLLLAAAADPVGDSGVLWRAAERLGVGPDAGLSAQSAGLIELGIRVRFPHPLVRSAIYAASSASDRRAVHGALADVTDRELDPDRCAWHRAHATPRPDEEVASEMVSSAGRAQRRGGLAAAAAFLQRASELTPDAAVRVDRALTAAQAKLDVADFASASTLVAAAELGPLDALQRGRLERLRAQIVFATRRGADAPALLLAAARRLEALDYVLARETYVEAISATLFAGSRSTHPQVRELIDCARESAATTPSNIADLLLDGLLKRFTVGYAASVPPLTQALRSLAYHDNPEEDQRWLWLACRLAQELWDDDLWHAVATRGAKIGRDTGRLSLLANSMNHVAAFNVHAGMLVTAGVQIDEVDAIEQATGLPPLKYSACLLTAARGDRVQMQVFWNTSIQNAARRGETQALSTYWCLSARIHNAHGEYDKALTDARRSCEHEDVISYGWALAECVEAGVRVGSIDEASVAFDHLKERTRASGTDWALGVEARCSALLKDDEACYQESLSRLGRSRAVIELARSQLCYGEWLRRANRRSDARELLRAAHEAFSRMGAHAFAERARRELLATGEKVRKRAGRTREALTPQEVHVALMAGDGHTNAEIGARLFISPRTAEYHLHKVFRKLGIGGRRDLRDALAKESYHTGVARD